MKLVLFFLAVLDWNNAYASSEFLAVEQQVEEAAIKSSDTRDGVLCTATNTYGLAGAVWRRATWWV